VPNLSIAIQTDIDLEQLRARLRKMSDAELIRFGKAARFLCCPGKEPPREAFVVQCRRRERSGGAGSKERRAISSEMWRRHLYQRGKPVIESAPAVPPMRPIR
jgi:hypothetical protein